MAKCSICYGEWFSRESVTVEYDLQNKKLIIENIPADVCKQCGERYFDAETTLKLSRIHKMKEYPDEQEILIPATVRNFNAT